MMKALSGKNPNRRKLLPDWRFLLRMFLLACAVALLIIAYRQLAGLGIEYEWHWNRAWRQFGRWTEHGFVPGPLCEGLALTLGIAATGLAASALLGCAAALLRISPWPLCSLFSLAYVAIFRNTPLLLQLFFVYFLLSPLFGLSPFWSAIFALSAFEGAYIAEILRAALLGVTRTQWEASLSLGFNVRQTLFMIIMPQALRNALPALNSQAVALIKDTSLVSAIAVADITMRAQAIVAETFLAFEIWLLVALIYLVLSLCLSLPGLWLEKYSTWR